MKIKLSKSQWELVGKTAGWIKSSQVVEEPNKKEICKTCRGQKYIYQKVKNLGTLDSRDSREVCPTCRGKGYTTKEDQDAYLHSMGVTPCPYGNNTQKGV